MHTFNKQSQYRRSVSRHSSPTKEVYVFRCGESGLYAFTADPKGHILPRGYTLRYVGFMCDV
jgi:hypothetical protein